jgi:hypothetical protein
MEAAGSIAKHSKIPLLQKTMKISVKIKLINAF